MSVIDDSDFGNIIIRRTSLGTQIRFRIAPNGNLRVSAPKYMPLILVKRYINLSRNKLIDLKSSSLPKIKIKDGLCIGKSHKLKIIIDSDLKKIRIASEKQFICIYAPSSDYIDSKYVYDTTHKKIIEALKTEARSYLPRRISFLAEEYDFKYKKIHFSHASSRWGSCSSSGTISLNIALMKLPFEIIDYVIIHELSHTVEMNHGANFWKIVEKNDPDFKKHQSFLKQESPAI
jgi:predicted metal-dependent hydrolase